MTTALMAGRWRKKLARTLRLWRPSTVSRRRILLGAALVGLVVDALYRRRSVRQTASPGLLIVQIDGLGRAALQAAIQRGSAPFLGGLLERRSASLGSWHAMVPPTTPASQAGIMHGHNVDIPGFRWYDKATRRVMVANHPADAADILRHQSDGNGLLAHDGASIGNLMNGDATRTYLTMASVAEEPRAPGTLIRLHTFLLSPVNGLQIVLGMAGEFATELYQGARQGVARLRPRMHRGVDSATERAFLNSLVPSLSTELAIAEMRIGTRVIYIDYTGYDAVAHHSGPERPEALDSVRGIDRCIERLVDAIGRARRPYRLVVLSDHGQSLGDPFATRYGERLDEFVAHAMGVNVPWTPSTESEHGHVVGLIAREIGGIVRIPAGVVRLAGRLRDAVASRGHTAVEKPELVVCASGNLAHLYFTVGTGRMTSEEIERCYPGLLDRLTAHPAVGIALVRSSSAGPLVLSRSGRRCLDRDEFEGDDPLATYGPHAAASLRRLDTFSNVGDVVLVSTLDPVTQQVVSFEPLVGCHGGLGGAQSEPFIFYPAEWRLADEPLVGAPSVHAQLREWLGALEA